MVCKIDNYFNTVFQTGWVIELDIKKIHKPLKKILKELKWRKYKLKLMVKRLERKYFEPTQKLNVHLQNSIDSIQSAIEEIEDGFENLRNLVAKRVIEKPKENIGLKTEEREIYDVLLCSIKLQIKPEMLSFIILNCLRRNKILILLDNHLAYLKNVFKEFFNFIFDGSFHTEIKPVLKLERMNILYHDYIIVENHGKLKENLNKSTPIEIKFVEEIIRDYYKENDIQIGRESLKYKLQELYALSKALIDFYHKKRNLLIPKQAIKHLEDIFFLKIKKDYFQFIVEIVKNYFNIDIKYVKDYVAEQIAQLMR